MIGIAICDDEKIYRDKLRQVLEIQLELKGMEYKITTFDCGEDFILALGQTHYDIIFLDIEMKALNGLETAKIIRKQDKKAVILFVTSHPDFVFQGYEVRALNYILKPFENQKIIELLHSALDELLQQQDRFYLVQLKSGTRRINLNETRYLVSDRRKINALTANGSVEFYGKLDDLEQELPEFFIRIHQRYLVNINYIAAVEKSSALVSGERLPVARSRMQPLMIAIAKTMLE